MSDRKSAAKPAVLNERDLRLTLMLMPVIATYEPLTDALLHGAMVDFVHLVLLTHPCPMGTVKLAMDDLELPLDHATVDIEGYTRWIRAHEAQMSRARTVDPRRYVAEAVLSPPGHKAATLLAMPPARTVSEALRAVGAYGGALMAALLAGAVGMSRFRGWGVATGLPMFNVRRGGAALDAALRVLSAAERTAIVDHYVDARIGLTSCAWQHEWPHHQASLVHLAEALQRLSHA